MRNCIRIGCLSELTGVAPLALRRLVEGGDLPARRLPGRRNWRFAMTSLPKILDVLAMGGYIEDAAKPIIMAKAAEKSGSDGADARSKVGELIEA